MPTITNFGTTKFWPPSGKVSLNRETQLARGLEMLILPSIGASIGLIDLAVGRNVNVVGGIIAIDKEIGPVYSTNGSNQGFSVIYYAPVISPEFSANFWFKGIQQTGLFGIWSWGDVAGDGTPFALIQANNANLRYFCDGNYRETSQTIATNTLYNIGISRNCGNIWSYYLNGRLLSTYTDDGTPTNLASAVNVWTAIGYSNSYYGSYGQSAFWSRELSPAEFQMLYNPQTRWRLVQSVEPPRFWSIPTAAPPSGNPWYAYQQM